MEIYYWYTEHVKLFEKQLMKHYCYTCTDLINNCANPILKMSKNGILRICIDAYLWPCIIVIWM